MTDAPALDDLAELIPDWDRSLRARKVAKATLKVYVPAARRYLDWLRAGQTLHRVLAHAATVWVAASLHTQPLEIPVIRNLIRSRLALPGSPQMVLQFGPAHASLASPRRPVPDFLIEGTSGGTARDQRP